MANKLERQIAVDGWRNVVAKFTGVLDSADATVVPALTLGDLQNNDPTARLWGLRVDTVRWSLSDGLLLSLEWNSADPQQVFEMAGRGHVKGCFYGGFVPNKLRPGFDGAINIRTRAFPTGTVANYTLEVEMVKLYTA